jgi:hypothetical protein
MSVNLKDLRRLGRVICRRYMSPPYKTMGQIGEELGVSYHTISAALRQGLTADQIRKRSAANKSRAKSGKANPMFGLRQSKGPIQRGAYMGEWDGQTHVLLHRQVFMRALGLSALPKGMQVHHIDGDKTNNTLDNLALVTSRGHNCLHRQRLKKLRLWEVEEFGTSRLPKIIATRRKE